MKNVLVVGLLILSQFAFAQVREVKTLTPVEAREAVERSSTYKMIEEMKRKGLDITSDRAMMDRVSKVLDLNLRGVVELSSGENLNLIKLLNVNTLDVMAEVARLSSIAKDPANASKPQAREAASTALRLMAKAGTTVKSLVLNSAEARTQAEAVKQIISISNKISSLDYGQASKSFIEKYEKALTEGKSVEEAIKIASNGKFTEKELRECE